MNPIKAKIFSYCTTDINPPNESQINGWLAEHPDITMVQMLQSEAMAAIDAKRFERNLTITLLYRDSVD